MSVTDNQIFVVKCQNQLRSMLSRNATEEPVGIDNLRIVLTQERPKAIIMKIDIPEDLRERAAGQTAYVIC